MMLEEVLLRALMGKVPKHISFGLLLDMSSFRIEDLTAGIEAVRMHDLRENQQRRECSVCKNWFKPTPRGRMRHHVNQQTKNGAGFAMQCEGSGKPIPGMEQVPLNRRTGKPRAKWTDDEPAEPAAA